MTPKNGIVETTEPGAKDAAAMASAGLDGFVKRFLASVPADVAPTFSQAQLLAVKEFVINKRDRQAIDIRWTIPLIWFRFFIVVLAGPERRSAERVALERAARPILTRSNIIAIGVFLVMLLISLVGVNYAVTMGTFFGAP